MRFEPGDVVIDAFGVEATIVREVHRYVVRTKDGEADLFDSGNVRLVAKGCKHLVGDTGAKPYMVFLEARVNYCWRCGMSRSDWMSAFDPPKVTP